MYVCAYRIVDKLKGKQQIMRLIEHPVELVRQQALLSVQKLLITNWEALETNVPGS